MNIKSTERISNVLLEDVKNDSRFTKEEDSRP